MNAAETAKLGCQCLMLKREGAGSQKNAGQYGEGNGNGRRGGVASIHEKFAPCGNQCVDENRCEAANQDEALDVRF
jgi:hypothetical protein